MFALVGGVVITLGTVATQYGWAYVGLLVTEVMASSLKVVIGTTLNYFLDGRINRAEVPFPGVGCFLIAACLGSLVHFSNAADNQEKLSNSRNYSAGNTAKEDLTQHLLQEEGEGTRQGDGRGRCCCWKKEHAYGRRNTPRRWSRTLLLLEKGARLREKEHAQEMVADAVVARKRSTPTVLPLVVICCCWWWAAAAGELLVLVICRCCWCW